MHGLRDTTQRNGFDEMDGLMVEHKALLKWVFIVEWTSAQFGPLFSHFDIHINIILNQIATWSVQSLEYSLNAEGSLSKAPHSR